MNDSKLTIERITELSNKKGVKKVAVLNFLCSLSGMSDREAMGNLSLDTSLYQWNSATVKAISQGIKEASLTK